MSENMEQRSESRETFTQVMIADMLLKNFDKLPEIDQKVFTYGPVCLGGNAGFAGMIANSLYRRVLNVQAASFASSLPMMVLPFLSTSALYCTLVSFPLLTANLNCPSCATTRGALIGLVGGGLYPIILALPVNLGLAARYRSAPLPGKGSIMRYCMNITKPVVRKMIPVLIIQAVFGSYLGSKHFQSYVKLAKITSSISEEEFAQLDQITSSKSEEEFAQLAKITSSKSEEELEC